MDQNLVEDNARESNQIISNDNEIGYTADQLESQEDLIKLVAEKESKELKFKKNILIGILSFVFIATLITSILAIIDRHSNSKKSFISLANNEDTTNYGCLIDAGSKGSRLYVFKWQQSKKDPLPDLTEINKISFKSPLAKIGSDVEIEMLLNNMAAKCKNEIKTLYPKIMDFRNVPFYLKATAGMRSIPIERQKQILKIVRKAIRINGFLYKNDDFAKVITGKDEGIYGWIALNYLNGILPENEKDKKIKKEPYGVLDLGGSSMEFTFLTDKTKVKDNQYKLKLKNIDYNIYTFCFDHLGQFDMYSTISDYLIKKNINEKYISHPCLLKDYSENYTYNNKQYYFNGTGNFEKCNNLIKENIKKGKCNYEKCSINGTYQPVVSKSQKFYAISGFAHVVGALGLKKNKKHSASEILAAAKTFCGKSYIDEKKNYEDAAMPYFRLYCYLGNYIYYLLVEGFGFDKDWDNIKFTKKINDKDSTWAVGAMLSEILNLN